MPAVATLEDLKAAQKEFCYSMRVCLKRSAPQTECSLSVTVISFHTLAGGKGSSHSKAGRGRHPPTDVGTGRPGVDGLLCRGKFWLQERTSEQLKGEGE